MLKQNAKPKLLFLVTEDYYFWSHRRLIAEAARDSGFDVYVATHVQKHFEDLKRAGFHVLPTKFCRSNRNVIHQILAQWELIQIYRRIRPDLVHHVALKSILFGSIAARLASVSKQVNLIAGLGVIFTDHRKKYKLISQIARLIARVLLDNKTIVVQNSDDFRELQIMVPTAKLHLIRGSGVDTSLYRPTQLPQKQRPVRAVLVGRMLWHKGVGEFVEAAKLLGAWGENIEMHLVGGIDRENPASISEKQLQDWHHSGVVSWQGEQKDIARVWAESDIAVLPSYREGLPKALLEAAACAQPLIAADTPGCREIVQDGINGFLVPKQNATALAQAIQKLAHHPKLRIQMGQEGRRLVCNEFSNAHVVEQTMRVYYELIPTIP